MPNKTDLQRVFRRIVPVKAACVGEVDVTRYVQLRWPTAKRPGSLVLCADGHDQLELSFLAALLALLLLLLTLKGRHEEVLVDPFFGCDEFVVIHLPLTRFIVQLRKLGRKRQSMCQQNMIC